MIILNTYRKHLSYLLSNISKDVYYGSVFG